LAATLRVALVEPFLTGSHRAWAEGLVAHSAHDVRLVAHDGSFWKWRMQGAALTLAHEVARHGRPDVLLVSDMVHVPALLGFAREALAGVPVVVYMHENQLTYPLPDDAAPDHTYAITNWLGMAAADRVVFNSDYHRRSWFDAIPKLLRRFPDYRHTAHVDAAAARAAVLPVGIDARRLATQPAARAAPTAQARSHPPLVLWNHRWEYDKDPAAAFDALRAVARDGIDFRLAVAGQQFQTVPPEFAAVQRDLAGRIVSFGTLDRPDYERLLHQADVVVSTARHEFFGLSILEAAAAGACPVVPDRLSYPELLPATALYHDGGLVERLRHVLTDDADRRQRADEAQQAALAYDWAVVAPRYDELLADVAKSRTMSADRDVEKSYTTAQVVAKLRRLADAIETDKPFRIQIAGERILVPDHAEFSIEHERGDDEEEIEFQLKWTRAQAEKAEAEGEPDTPEV